MTHAPTCSPSTRSPRRHPKALVRPAQLPWASAEALEARLLLSAATQLVIGLQPTFGSAGQPTAFGIEVDVEDALGNIVTTDNSTVKLALRSGPSGALQGTTTVQAVNGIATFNNVIFSKNGSYTVVASDGSLTKATTNPIAIGLGVTATQLQFDQQPVGNPVGGTITTPFTVDVLDQFSQPYTAHSVPVTLKIESGPAGAKISGKLTVNSSNGIATFSNVSLSKGGSYILEATSGKMFDTSVQFTMGGPSVASSIQFLQQPTTVTAGTNMTPPVTVEVLDQYGNVLTSDHSVVKLTGTNGPLKVNFSAPVKGGIATFSKIDLTVAGNYTFTATDNKLATITSNQFTVNPAAGTHLAFFNISDTGTNHTDSAQAIVVVLDKFNNIATADTSTVTLTYASAPKGVTPLSITAPVSSGAALFSGLTFPVAGKYSLRASDSPFKPIVSKTFTLS